MRTGWARSIGGAAPYLTLFARAGLRRIEIDAALADVEIHELPAVRGCTYVVPAADYPLALAAGVPFADDELKVARKLGVTDKEIAKLRAAVVKALAGGPLEPEALRTKVGNAARNLGPDGAKKGLTTTLPVALGLLQSAGEIRRIPVNGRIDQQRYRYAAWKCNVSGSFTDLARRYFSWIGPVPLSRFSDLFRTRSESGEGCHRTIASRRHRRKCAAAAGRSRSVREIPSAQAPTIRAGQQPRHFEKRR